MSSLQQDGQLLLWWCTETDLGPHPSNHKMSKTADSGPSTKFWKGGTPRRAQRQERASAGAKPPNEGRWGGISLAGRVHELHICSTCASGTVGAHTGLHLCTAGTARTNYTNAHLTHTYAHLKYCQANESFPPPCCPAIPLPGLGERGCVDRGSWIDLASNPGF